MKDKDFTSAGTMYLYTKSKADLDAVILDGNVRYDFYKGNIPRKMSFLAIAKTDQIRLGALLGYRYEKFDYEMHDIYYDTDLISGRQGQTLYSGQKVLTYKLQNYLPYLGIAADIIGRSYGLGMTFKYSFYPTAEDVDNHILRGLTFYGQYGNHRNAYMVGLNGFWRWTKLWKVRFGMDATIIRIEGRTWEEQRSPAWDGDQSTATNEFIYWSGLEYKF
jgi:outer membrane protease